MRTTMISRREFLSNTAALAMATAEARFWGFAQTVPDGAAGSLAKKIVVGGHLWVYAADRPRYDPTPVLEKVIADFKYAGLDCVELMHLILLHDEAVDHIGSLIEKYKLPVVRTSMEAAMWKRSEHAATVKDAEVFIPRLATLGGRTMGTSVGRAGENARRARCAGRTSPETGRDVQGTRHCPGPSQPHLRGRK